MSLSRYRLHIFPMEPLHLGMGAQRGNVLPCLPWIPGRALRGALAGWAIRNGHIQPDDSDFAEMFGEAQDGEESIVSYPYCYPRKFLPAPLSLFEAKGREGDPRYRYLFERDAFLAFKGRVSEYDGSRPIDFLRRKEWPADLEDFMLRQASSTAMADGESFCYRMPATEIQLRAAHDDKTRRVSDSGLFGEELLPRAEGQLKHEMNSTYYCGQLLFSKEDVFERLLSVELKNFYDQNQANPFAWPEMVTPQRLIFLGHRRVPAAIFATDESPNGSGQRQGEKESKNGVECTLTFTSDLRLAQGRDPFPLNEDVFNALFRDTGIEVVQVLRVFCARGTVGGFARDIGDKSINVLKRAPTVRAGSCALVRITGDLEKLTQLGQRGVGAGTRDGCGRFLVDAPIHTVERTNSEEEA